MKNVLKKELIAELFSVSGKTVLVTGAGGIGEAVACAFAKNRAVVYVADYSEQQLKNTAAVADKAGVGVRTIVLDVCDTESVHSCFATILNERDKLDVVIHTAGICWNAPAIDFDEGAIRAMLDVNLLGTIKVNQEAARIMKEQGGGKIVNFGSIAGLMNHVFNSMPYEASKAAVHQVTRSFAAEMAEYNINVNCIAPAWVNTPMSAGRNPEYYKSIRKVVPFGRMCEPEELFGAVFFLASDASCFVTGQTIAVDGGWSISKAFTTA